MTTPDLRILRVTGLRSRQPAVLATVDDAFVRWSPRDGWTCDCDTEGDTCDHVDLVASVLDPRVIGAAS